MINVFNKKNMADGGNFTVYNVFGYYQLNKGKLIWRRYVISQQLLLYTAVTEYDQNYNFKAILRSTSSKH